MYGLSWSGLGGRVSGADRGINGPRCPGGTRCNGREVGSRPISRVLSWTAIHLGRTSPCASSDLPGDPRGPRGAIRRPRAPLFGLAPGGVYPAIGVTTDAVRSYRTISTLPPRLSAGVGGIFSVALSVGSRPPGVTWHPALRGPDFPPPRVHTRSGDCLADSPWQSIPRMTCGQGQSERLGLRLAHLPCTRRRALRVL